MFKILIILSLFFNVSFAIGEAYTQSSSQLIESDEIDTETGNLNDYLSGAVSRISKTTNKILDGEDTTETETRYFESATSTSCTTVQDLICPPLVPSKKENFVTKINWINPKSGQVSCSVYSINQDGDLWNSWKKESVIQSDFTQIFTRKVCKNTFSETGNFDKTTEIENMRILAISREAELKDIKFQYSSENMADTGKTYLDMGDFLDSLLTIDPEKIDIEKSLKQGEIHTMEGYTIIPNDSVIDKFQSSLTEMIRNKNNTYWNIFQKNDNWITMPTNTISTDEIDAELVKHELSNTRIKDIANSNYIMYLRFFIESNDILNHSINMFLAIFLIYNILIGYGFKHVTSLFHDLQKHENHSARLIGGFSLLLLMYVGNANVLKFEDENGQLKEIEVKSQRVQVLLRSIFSVSNEMADKLAEVAISSYLDTLMGSTKGLASLDMINSLSSEKMSLIKENKLLKSIETDMCQATYNTVNLTNSLSRFRAESKNDDSNFDVKYEKEWWKIFAANDVTQQIVINPYPINEIEAVALAQKNKTGVYDDSGDNFVNKNYFRYSKFHETKQWLSMGGCSSNRKKLIENNRRIYVISEKLKVISDSKGHDDIMARLRNVNTVMWKQYHELGYISVALLPATAMLINQQQSLGDANIDEDKTYLQQLQESVVVLSLFGGKSIADLFKNVIPNPAKLVSSIPIIGGFADEISNTIKSSISYIMAYKVIYLILDTIVMVILISSGLLVFLLLAIQKAWVFVAVLFSVIYAFSASQEEKILAVFSKVIAVSFKSSLFVFAIFFTIWGLSMMDSFETLIVTDFLNMVQIHMADSADTFSIDGATNELQYYVLQGLLHVVFIVVKLILMYSIIFQFPNYFYEAIGVGINQAGEAFQDKVLQRNESQTMKGL